MSRWRTTAADVADLEREPPAEGYEPTDSDERDADLADLYAQRERGAA